MKIISYNVNGIRASVRKGLNDWLNFNDVDIFCFQESRASLEQINNAIKNIENYDYHIFNNVAEKRGYSGTMILSKIKPIAERKDVFNSLEDKEGRILMLEFKNFLLINLYIPHGHRLNFKLDFMNKFLNDLEIFIKKEIKPIIICSDFNIAHTHLDLSHPKRCENSTGYLPIEREMFDRYENAGLIDIYRLKNPNTQIFTWSSPNSKLFNNMRGIRYRFDYIFITKNLKNKVLDVDVLFDKNYSDHYPVFVKLDDNLLLGKV